MLTGGTVIPSGNPLDVLRRDHHAVKRYVIASSLREGKPWLIKPGQRMLFSLGRQIVYERETRTRKPKLKPDALSQWRTMEVQCNYVTWTDEREEEDFTVIGNSGKRRVGQPKKTWRRSIEEEVQTAGTTCDAVQKVKQN